MIGGNGGNQFRKYAGQNAGNLNGYNAVQNVGNQVAQNLRVQNVGNQNGPIGVQGNGNQNQIGNGNLVAVRAEENTAGHNGNQIRCYNCRGIRHFARDCTEVNANCILMANLQQASSLGTQTDKALVYDFEGSAEVHEYENCYNNEIFNMFTQEEQYTELLEPIPEPQQVPQNDNNVISEVTDVEQGGEAVEQHSTNFEETRALYDSLYQNLAIEVEKVNSVNRKLKETNADLTTELSKYVLEILNKYGMESCDPIVTPMEIKDKLDLDQNGTSVDATKYRSMIGALMYLTSSRPDIVHATCLCARYQAKPTEKHFKEVKRIFCYLQGTVNTGLWYSKDSGFELTEFLDADYARYKDTFKSTSGEAQFLGEKLVSWSSKKQDCTTLSTAEAEYVSLSACCA
uniref:Uncharacterized mitochondrial protein AtMg00810-like n=1 Tax=Tanacetum cinerariifolium TaxID=118510 RepID=A0A6L2M516_TANCI|nr:uncharacterized mitochondrial protein AtMg00810-like [Tanacetum cinerariifolium]